LSTDDDCWFDDAINLEAAVELASQDDCGAVQITRLMPGKKPTPNGKHHKVALTWMGAGMVFRKKAWSLVGGYPPDYLDDVMFGALLYARASRTIGPPCAMGITK